MPTRISQNRFKISWYGNFGRAYPNPGVKDSMKCGICNTRMVVERNILGPRSFIESLAKVEVLHDSFTCPNLDKKWHREIYELKFALYLSEIDERSNEQKKEAVEKEILKLLKANLK